MKKHGKIKKNENREKLKIQKESKKGEIVVKE